MKKRLFGAAIAMAATAALITGCAGGATPEAGGGDGEKPYIAIISKGFQHQFWQAVRAGAEQAAEEFDVEITFEGPDTEADVDQQIQMLQTALDKNPAAIGFAALDSQAAGPLLQQASDSGIPVVAFDSGVDSDIPVTTASTDNLAAAAEAAKHMVEAIGEEGKIAVVAHDQTSLTGQQRRDGFVEYIEENAPNVEIVDVQYGGGDQAKSADLAKAIISANPDLKGIYGTNEGSAIGVVQAVKELGLSPDALAVVGFDSGKAQLDAIRDGLMLGAITQNPVGIGYETVKAAVEAINGETLPATIDTGFYWYDSTNIDDPTIAAVLYE
ncbi:ribose transport system substrate-binding protein [Microbacteriaceae bacterium SG_E_30_P1]|uniref:Ribose transport system substrate-binding protein n=1 Tax=Antiquaquibacter oligotrophicus TaxID=2880260 RepID=A0ABT6KR97_9MICO|nr:ABC transporter substrate-binding protein [Antiquaquibacter oligotrophicus]MDH6182351.1 ribose transport system substrate-binding protein [Antiquaquibacter oligotrophicus]UDF11996.1 ABC transporter substrate-binding protein [Antiquaquibacter oligotrophicus]